MRAPLIPISTALLWPLLVWMSFSALAAQEVPVTLMGVTNISALEAQALIKRGARVVDARAQHDFLDGHISRAIHVAYRERSAQKPGFDPSEDNVRPFLNRMRKKIPDLNSEVIIHCCGVNCWKSYKALRAATDHGYRKLYWLRGGMEEWRQENLPVTQE